MTSYDRSLNDFLGRDERPEQDGFVIDDEAKADWALRKIREAEARVEQVETFAEQRKQEIDQWAIQETTKEQNSIDFFTQLLEVYHRKLHAADPKKKTIKLPAGELQLRKSQPRYVRDEDKLLLWLKENRPDFIRVKESPDWSRAKSEFALSGDKLVDPDTGLVVEGVEVQEDPRPNFRVKTNKEEG